MVALVRYVAFAGLVGLGCHPASSPMPAPVQPESPSSVETPSAEAETASGAAQTEAPTKAAAPKLYQASYGHDGPPLVFLHGGPGYNSAVFEATTAEVLAQRYRVVVYDRRGTGRSDRVPDGTASFTFAQAVADLESVLDGMNDPILVGHSFGGAVALRYLDAHPDFAGVVVLVNAPISYPRTLSTIIFNCRAEYEARQDATQLGYLDKLEGMDHDSAAYVGFTFMHGIGCGLYQPSKPTAEAGKIYERAGQHPDARYFSDSQPIPVAGFIEHERYASLDLSDRVVAHADRLWAIYADEDRIIAPEDRAFLRRELGDRYVEIPGAAHNVFVDQQAAFVAALARVRTH